MLLPMVKVTVLLKLGNLNTGDSFSPEKSNNVLEKSTILLDKPPCKLTSVSVLAPK